jgi:Conjugal transfer protein TrbL
MDPLLNAIKQLYGELGRIDGYLYTLVHPNLVAAALLDDSLGLLISVWSNFILQTTDFENHGGPFVNNLTIQRFEPKVQLAANVALALLTMWAAYRIMWSHGLSSQYTARILLPRLMMGVVLINFSQSLFQMAVDASNTISAAVHTYVSLDDLSTFAANFRHDPNAGVMEIITTAGLAAAYDVLAIVYLVRYAVLIVLAITAPIAGLFFMLPETHHMSKMWASQFSTNLLMQPIQLFVLSIGFALEKDGHTPVHHLFALASLLIVFKVPGALGGSEKVAHKLESTVHEAFKHIAHAVAKA